MNTTLYPRICQMDYLVLNALSKLFMTTLDCIGETETEDPPMHLKIDFDAEDFPNSFGIFKTDPDWLWAKSQKPPEALGYRNSL